MVKFCIDCVHFNGAKSPKCKRLERQETSPLTGESYTVGERSCDNERSSPFFYFGPPRCGPDARFFEQKPQVVSPPNPNAKSPGDEIVIAIKTEGLVTDYEPVFDWPPPWPAGSFMAGRGAWIAHDGFGCPVSEDSLVKVMTSDGWHSPLIKASTMIHRRQWDWADVGLHRDAIVKYRKYGEAG